MIWPAEIVTAFSDALDVDPVPGSTKDDARSSTCSMRLLDGRYGEPKLIPRSSKLPTVHPTRRLDQSVSKGWSAEASKPRVSPSSRSGTRLSIVCTPLSGRALRSFAIGSEASKSRTATSPDEAISFLLDNAGSPLRADSPFFTGRARVRLLVAVAGSLPRVWPAERSSLSLTPSQIRLASCWAYQQESQPTRAPRISLRSPWQDEGSPGGFRGRVLCGLERPW